MNIFKSLTASLFLLLFVGAGNAVIAQNTDTLKRDSLVIKPHILDSTLIDKDIFRLLEESSGSGRVKISQTQKVKDAYYMHLDQSSKRKITGYRIRIFFDNNQSARGKSEAVASQFAQMYPGVPVYRSYTNPYFKVTVGDYRSKSEAMKMLKELEGLFQSAFLIKETINFPPL